MLKLEKFLSHLQISTLTMNFSEVWPMQILDLVKQYNLMIRLENVLKTSLQDVLKTSWRRMVKTNKFVLIKTSWRRLGDVFWRRMSKAKIFVLIKTSCRYLEDFFWRRRWKTSLSKRMFAGIQLQWRPSI